MDQRGVKRPRSNTPSKADATAAAAPPKKKNKDKSRKKKNKANRENRPSAISTNDEEKNAAAPSTSHESVAQHPRTASPNGQRMSQILSTFSSVEHSRWEAYRRVVFPGDAMEQYVAFLLRERMHRRHGNQRPTVAAAAASTTTNSLQLRDLVAPRQAHEIGLVVSTLAKAYAQRLVTASIAEQQRQTQRNSNEPLAPENILKAHESRQAQGLDPGFFLQSRQDSQVMITPTAMGSNGDDIERLAALAAQEEYDQRLKQQQQQNQAET